MGVTGVTEGQRESWNHVVMGVTGVAKDQGEHRIMLATDRLRYESRTPAFSV